MQTSDSEPLSPASSYGTPTSDISIPSPFDALAAELISSIFRNLDFCSLVAASHVCATWRQVAISDPAAWTNLDLHGWRSLPPAALDEIISRACALPFALHRLRIREEDGADFASVLWKHMRRATSLELEIVGTGTWQLIEPGLEVAAPLLESLTLQHKITRYSIGSTSREPPMPRPTLFAGMSPRLRYLCLDGILLPDTFCPAFTTVAILAHIPPPASAQRIDLQAGWRNLSSLFPCLSSLHLTDIRRGRPLIGTVWSTDYNHSISELSISLTTPSRGGGSMDLRRVLASFWHANVQQITLDKSLSVCDETVEQLMAPGTFECRRATHMELVEWVEYSSSCSFALAASVTFDCGLDYPIQRRFGMAPSSAPSLISQHSSTLVTLRCSLNMLADMQNSVFLELTMLTLDIVRASDQTDETEYFMRRQLSATASPKLRCLEFRAHAYLMKHFVVRKKRSQLPALAAGPLLDVVQTRRQMGCRTLSEIVLESLSLRLDSDSDRIEASRLTQRIHVIAREPGPSGTRRRLHIPCDACPAYCDA